MVCQEGHGEDAERAEAFVLAVSRVVCISHKLSDGVTKDDVRKDDATSESAEKVA